MKDKKTTLLNPGNILSRFSNKIGDYMQKQEFVRYSLEVKDFIEKHGGPNKTDELEMFSTLFLN